MTHHFLVGTEAKKLTANNQLIKTRYIASVLLALFCSIQMPMLLHVFTTSHESIHVSSVGQLSL